MKPIVSRLGIQELNVLICLSRSFHELEEFLTRQNVTDFYDINIVYRRRHIS